MRRSRLAAVLLPSLLVVLAACGSGSTDQDAASGAASPSAQDPPTAAAEPEVDLEPSPESDDPGAPDADAPTPEVLRFTARTVDDQRFSGADLAGRPAVLWFWAPWCAVCRSQIPMVEDLAATYGEDLGVVGVGSLDSAAAIAGFAEDTSGITQLSDQGGELWRRFGIVEQSSFVVLDASGEEVLRSGYASDDGVPEAVERLLG